MISQLKSISANMAKAAILLEKVPSSHTGIDNIIMENAYELKRLEAYAASLAETIELTIKSTKP